MAGVQAVVYDLSKFLGELATMADDQVGRVVEIQRSLAFAALGAAVEVDGRFVRIPGVVLLTPVDTGRARSSWNLSVGDPNTSVPPPGEYGGGVRPDTSPLARLGPYRTVWITSSLPYIEILEFGGYPDPPERGSWDRRARRYVVKSSGGYSRQAPRGMVRVTFDRLVDALESGGAA